LSGKQRELKDNYKIVLSQLWHSALKHTKATEFSIAL